MGTLAEDARALMAATADVGGEKVCEARKRLAAELDSGKISKATDQAVHEHLYEAIGLALGRCSRNGD